MTADVTTPKLGPAPRMAHQRSGFSSEMTMIAYTRGYDVQSLQNVEAAS